MPTRVKFIGAGCWGLRQFQISDSKFQTSDFKLPMSDFRFQVSDSRFRASDFRFQIALSSSSPLTADCCLGARAISLNKPPPRALQFRFPKTELCRLLPAYLFLPTPYCRLPTAHCPLPTAHCPLPTAHCPLPTAYCLLSLRSLPKSGHIPMRSTQQAHSQERRHDGGKAEDRNISRPTAAPAAAHTSGKEHEIN